MAKGNNLSKLNEVLFDELYRLCDENLEGVALEAEIERSKAVSGIAKNIIDNGRLVVQTAQARQDGALQKAIDDTCRRQLRSGE